MTRARSARRSIAAVVGSCVIARAAEPQSAVPEVQCGERRWIELPSGRNVRVSGGGATFLKFGPSRWAIWSGIGCGRNELALVTGRADVRRVQMFPMPSFSPMFAAPHGVAFNAVVPGDIGRLDYYAEDGTRRSTRSADAVPVGEEDLLVLVPSDHKTLVRRIRPWPKWRTINEVVVQQRCWQIREANEATSTLAGCGEDEASEAVIRTP